MPEIVWTLPSWGLYSVKQHFTSIRYVSLVWRVDINLIMGSVQCGKQHTRGTIGEAFLSIT